MIPIIGKSHGLGDGFTVTRLLPQAARRSIGPFLFFDYFGPATFPPGKGIDVRPHPHIGLATITYLFQGSQMHRDTLGSFQEITPGAVNWMTAGRGIAHSERTGDAVRAAGHTLHGIQSWVGLPTAHEEAEPDFQHYPAEALPTQDQEGVYLKMIVGSAFGMTSPVKVFSPIFYADAQFEAGGRFEYQAVHEERALFIVEGEIQTGDDAHGAEMHGPGTMLFLQPGEEALLYADQPARVMLLGGAPLDGPRHIWWNFVSSSKDRIEKAKQDWREGAFGFIPGDDGEFIPLPPDPKPPAAKA